MEDKTVAYKEVNKAYNLALIALIGIFIPILGLLLAFIANITLRGVESHSKNIAAKKRNTSSIITLAIIVSLVSSVAWGYYVYDTQRNEEQTQNTIATQAQEACEQQVTTINNKSLNLMNDGAITLEDMSDLSGVPSSYDLCGRDSEQAVQNANADYEADLETAKNNCIDEVNKAINKSTAGRYVDNQTAQTIIAVKEQRINECRDKYSSF